MRFGRVKNEGYTLDEIVEKIAFLYLVEHEYMLSDFEKLLKKYNRALRCFKKIAEFEEYLAEHA
jgi:hypothetical protein